ncbi:MAG: 5-formyltetrahydrofolate cyclo-ligase [Alphaproteobacteria bacterium]|jgi:5-formyltetrahydrofolate cyclo-ligase
MSVHDEKILLRKEAAARRADIHARLGAAAGGALAARFVEALADRLTPGIVVSLYRTMRDEIDVGPLGDALAARGVVAALPVMQGADAPLAFRSWHAGDALADAAFGVREPAGGETVTPDILAVPLLAFDARGHRLGYGGGYYDRTLRSLRAVGDVLAVGVAYDEQETVSVPVDDRDETLDMIVTDRRAIVPGA